MDPANAGWDEAGRLVCRACLSAQVVREANATIEEKDPTTARNLYAGSLSAVGLGVGTCVLTAIGEWMFLLPLAVMINGAWVALYVLRHPETKPQLGARYYLVLIAGIVGALLGLAALGASILSFVAEGMFASDF